MVNASVVATVSTVLPGFLFGALSVQISADMGVSEAVYGWGLGSFFGAATIGSIMLGRLAQKIGALNQTTLAARARSSHGASARGWTPGSARAWPGSS